MRIVYFYFVLVVIGFLSMSYITSVSEDSGSEIVREMFKKSASIKTITYVMKKQERINGILIEQQTFCKINHNPLKVYLRQQRPKEGLEVLYVHGQNNNNALINTNGFPWVNLSLDPMGSIMRENQHHTLYESGYAHMVSILEHLTAKYGKEADGFMKNEGTIVWNNRPCWHIIFTNPHFNYYKYTLKQGETILSIAAKAKLSEHMILELNKKLKSYSDATSGQTIIIPNDYSPKLELYIDKELKMPLLMKVYDEKGLYENYDYKNVVINPIFSPSEFDKSNPEYNF
jgi:outer membrane lipoprotein-sorting protein